MSRQRTATLKIRNWSKYQHYSDRNMVWLKLYGTILEDYDFCSLPDSTKAHAILMLILAMRTNNEIPDDAEWIARRLHLTEVPDIDILVDIGWIEKENTDISTIIKINKVPANGTSAPNDHFSELPKNTRKQVASNSCYQDDTGAASDKRKEKKRITSVSDVVISSECPKRFELWCQAMSDASNSKWSLHEQWVRHAQTSNQLPPSTRPSSTLPSRRNWLFTTRECLAPGLVRGGCHMDGST